MLENIGGAAGVGIGAAVIALWRQFQVLIFRITGVLFARYELNGTIGLAARHYLTTESRWTINLGSTLFRSSVALTTRERRFEYIGFEMLNESGALFVCRYGILVGSESSSELDRSSLKLTSVRGLFRIRKFLNESMLVYNRSTYEVPKRYCLLKRCGAGSVHARRAYGTVDTPPTGSARSIDSGDVSSYDTAEALRRKNLQLVTHGYEDILETSDLGGGENHDPFHGLFYSADIMSRVEGVQSWLGDRQWYEDRSIPWRLGWLLYGPPGTGKTRLVVAIAKKYDMPIIFFDLASMSNEEFESEWKNAQALAPCMVVFEDFCRTFHVDKNMIGEEGGGLALTTILNCMSGGETAHGIFTVITANTVENVSPAIGQPVNGRGSSRPGRTDAAIKLDTMAPKEQEALVRFMLDGLPEKQLIAVLQATRGMTAAQATNVCVDFGRAWRKEQNGESLTAGRVEESIDREDTPALELKG